MDYRILYTQRALDDLAGIIGHIAEDSAESATRFGESLLQHVELLGHFPRLGILIRARSHVRRLVHSPILIYYRIHDDRQIVEVLHFRHGSRKPAKI